MMDEELEWDEGTVTLCRVREKEDGSLEECRERSGKWAWKDTADGTVVPLCGDVRFHEVEFGYTEKKQILKKISLYAKPGQKIAFVGSTGAGKTTIINLINRFYDVQGGCITYDGIDVKKSRRQILEDLLDWYFRTLIYLRGRLQKISAMEIWMQVRRKWSRQRNWPMQILLSGASQTDTIR